MAVFYIDSPSQGILELSSTTQVSVSETSTPTKFKLETGETITDNVTVGNIQISFSGIISNIRSVHSVSSQDDGRAREIFQDPVKGYIEALRSIKESKELFTVRYDKRFVATSNCVITNLSYDKDTNTGLGYNVSLSFEQVRISGRATTSEVRSIQKFPDDTQAKTDSGSNNQQKVDVEDSDTKISRSLFAAGVRQVLRMEDKNTSTVGE